MRKKISNKKFEKQISKPEKKLEKITLEEFEKKVLELAEKDFASEKIGETLKKEGIHPKGYSKKISAVLKEKGRYASSDIKNLEKKLEKIKAHAEKNRQDKKAMREKERIFAKLRKIKKYNKMIVQNV